MSLPRVVLLLIGLGTTVLATSLFADGPSDGTSAPVDALSPREHRALARVEAVLMRRNAGSRSSPGRGDPELLAAALELAHLATSRADWSRDLDALVHLAQGHDDPEVARIGRLLRARREGRETASLISLDPEARSRRQIEKEEIFAGARHQDPEIRRQAILRLVDWALGGRLPPEARARFLLLLRLMSSDPDPRIAAYASSIAAGFAGNPEALRMVYVAPNDAPD